MLRVVTDDDSRAEMCSAIDEICAEGARRMLAAALEAEVDGYIAALADERDERGRRLVVRNGHAEARTITTGGRGHRGRGAEGERQAARPRHRSAGPVPQLDPHPLVPQEPEGPRCCR